MKTSVLSIQAFNIILLFLFLTPNINAQLPSKKKQKNNAKFEKEVEKQSKAENRLIRKLKPNSYKKGCPCRKNIIRNGNFIQGTDTGNGSRNISTSSSSNAVKVTHWNKGTNTPKYASASGFSTPGLVVMWGNKVVSESIWQKVSFKKGKTYKGCFAFKFNQNNNRRPKNIRFKLRASKNANLNSPACPGGNCGLVTVSQSIYHEDGWQTHSFEWVADDNYNYLYVTPENDSRINGAAHISGGCFDDLCIEEKSCEPLKPYTGFELKDINVEGNIITHVEFKSTITIPNGAVHWWNIYDAENCTDDNDYSHVNNSGLRNIDFDSNFSVDSPDGNFPNLEINKCYIIKHGLYYSKDHQQKECGWSEKRAKLKVTFSANNMRGSKPKVEFILNDVSTKKKNRNR